MRHAVSDCTTVKKKLVLYDFFLCFWKCYKMCCRSQMQFILYPKTVWAWGYRETNHDKV